MFQTPRKECGKQKRNEARAETGPEVAQSHCSGRGPQGSRAHQTKHTLIAREVWNNVVLFQTRGDSGLGALSSYCPLCEAGLTLWIEPGAGYPRPAPSLPNFTLLSYQGHEILRKYLPVISFHFVQFFVCLFYQFYPFVHTVSIYFSPRCQVIC